MMNDPYLTTWNKIYFGPDRPLWKSGGVWLAVIGFAYQAEMTVNLMVRVGLSAEEHAMVVVVFLGFLEMAILTRSWLFWNELRMSRSLAASVPEGDLRQQILWLAQRNIISFVFSTMGIGLAELFAFMILIRF